MKRRAGITFAAVLLALGFWSLTAYSADDDDEKKAIKDAQQAVLKLMDSVNEKKGDVKAQAEAIRKKFEEVKPIMWVYKQRSKGGLGMGKDGVDMEREIGKIGSRTGKMRPKQILDMKADIAKAAALSRAIVEITDLYADVYKDTNTGKKNPLKWKQHTQAMSKGADELIAASKGNDVAKIKTAAFNLSASCTECHSDFRQ